MTQYLVKYWINVDMLAEEVVDSEHINIDTNDLGKFKEPVSYTHLTLPTIYSV